MNVPIKEEILVDVILPNYNKSTFLKEAIDSVVNQSFRKFHLYIIDDNSTDNSIRIINNYSKLENITIIKLNKNMGPSFCRNYGMRVSKSKYISFIDSDDTWMKEKLEKQIYFMEKENLSFTYTDYIPFFEKEGKKQFKKRTSLKDSFNFDTFTKNSSINTTTMVIRRSILKNIRFRNIKLCEDYLFKCNLLKKNKTAKKLNENTAFYRILEKSRSSKRIENIYWLWYINKTYNGFNFIQNIISIALISLNSIKKYGIK
tara:strand:- start:3503 stop:4279 length:777 start_codon:yes stop_codon:yes gene_type:complete